MKVGILTRNSKFWSSIQLRKALAKRHIPHICFTFPQLTAQIGYKPYIKKGDFKILEELDALIVRPIGLGSLEEITFRMNVLSRLQRLGMYVINPPEAIENCADKYNILSILEENNLPVPRTSVTENVDKALQAFQELGEDVIVKPIFGSGGIGCTRITDLETAANAFQTIKSNHGVIYLQDFIPHHHTDLRGFVIGNQVIAAMQRVSDSWKTNYSQGGKPVPIKLDKKLKKITVKAAKLTKCKIAGIDILKTPKGPLLLEVNSQPGWKGLQTVTETNIADKIVDFVISDIKT